MESKGHDNCVTVDERNIININDETSAKSLLDTVDYILTDCDGVLYLNNQTIPGTPQVFDKLRQMGKKILFVSNNSTRSRLQLQEKFKKMGFNVTLDEIFVTSYVAAEYFKSKNFQEEVYVFGCAGIKNELDLLGIKNSGVGADVEGTNSDGLVPAVELNNSIKAVIVGYDNLISLPKLVKACTYARQVDPELFVATNTDETFPTSNADILVPGTGAFVNFVKTAVGREPIIMGKPNPRYWDAIKRTFNDIDSERTLMIGDRLNTDIAFGNINGIKYTLLVGTGVHNMKDVVNAVNDKNYHLVPSHYIHSLGDLNKYL